MTRLKYLLSALVLVCALSMSAFADGQMPSGDFVGQMPSGDKAQEISIVTVITNIISLLPIARINRAGSIAEQHPSSR
jgi:hypothetical protein